MLWRKQQFTSGWNVSLREEEVSMTKRVKDGQQQTELEKSCKNSSNCAWKSSAYCQEHSRASKRRQGNRKILIEDLDMRRVCAKMVPKELTEEQKQRRVTICQDLLERQDDILGRVITGDETWVYQYDPETKRQSAQWKTANSPRPKNSVGPNQDSKQCCWLFFYIRVIFHYEFAPTGQTVNQVYYLEVLERLREEKS